MSNGFEGFVSIENVRCKKIMTLQVVAAVFCGSGKKQEHSGVQHFGMC